MSKPKLKITITADRFIELSTHRYFDISHDLADIRVRLADNFEYDVKVISVSNNSNTQEIDVKIDRSKMN